MSGDKRGVFFNRDEKRTRSHGLPPQIRTVGAQRVLMPLDPDAGGTWIGVNTAGLIVAVLNNYPHYQELEAARSRGQLVVDLLERHSSVGEMCAALQATDFSIYRGLILFAMGRDGEPSAWRWDGTSVVSLALWGCNRHRVLTTSSVRREECEQFREALFASGADDPEARRVWHRRYNQADPALGPLMCREDAATDSLIEIQLSGGSARMDFQTVRGDPPEAGQVVSKTLGLVSE